METGFNNKNINMKRHKILSILAGILLIGFFSGCEKDYQVYNANLHAARFTASPDSLTYSFGFYPNKETDTITVPVMILGFSEDRYRIVNIVEDSEKTTAVAENDYEILPCRIPAGKVSDSARIVLKRTDKLDNQTLCVAIKITDSEDLSAGPDNTYRIFFTNQLVQPANWPTQFGKYSVVKHQFCIEVLGVGDYCSWNDHQTITYYLRQLTEALLRYNNEHPDNPLTDEDGERITFNS